MQNDHSRRNRRSRRSGGRRSGRALWLAIVAIIAVALGAFAFAAQDSSNDGSLAAESTTHDFGQVPINGGLLATEFPLAVTGSVSVADLFTN
jgi:hypothetical protein